MSSVELWVWLTTRECVGSIAQKRLLAHFGSIEFIYASNIQELSKVEGISKKQIMSVLNKDTSKAQKIIDSCIDLGISIITLYDSQYPELLRQIPDPPCVLYIKGRFPDLERRLAIAVVGTRKASKYGIDVTKQMTQELTAMRFTIVTGMALGIDGVANAAAIEAGGKTIAVLGSGLDVCYPKAHAKLMQAIIENGAVVSEYPPGTQPFAKNFPQRNRIISGLSAGVLVIEAGVGSGAIITAREALDQGRDVYTVPANIDIKSFEGSNKMIVDGEAMPIISASAIGNEYYSKIIDFNQHVNGIKCAKVAQNVRQYDEIYNVPVDEIAQEIKQLKKEQKKPVKQDIEPKYQEELEEDETKVLGAIESGASSIDEIIESTGMNTQDTVSAVTMLELDGFITRDYGRFIVSNKTLIDN